MSIFKPKAFKDGIDFRVMALCVIYLHDVHVHAYKSTMIYYKYFHYYVYFLAIPPSLKDEKRGFFFLENVNRK